MGHGSGKKDSLGRANDFFLFKINKPVGEQMGDRMFVTESRRKSCSPGGDL